MNIKKNMIILLIPKSKAMKKIHRYLIKIIDEFPKFNINKDLDRK